MVNCNTFLTESNTFHTLTGCTREATEPRLLRRAA